MRCLLLVSVAVVGVGAVDPTPTCSWTDGTCAAQLVLTVDMLPRPLGLEEAPRYFNCQQRVTLSSRHVRYYPEQYMNLCSLRASALP